MKKIFLYSLLALFGAMIAIPLCLMLFAAPVSGTQESEYGYVHSNSIAATRLNGEITDASISGTFFNVSAKDIKTATVTVELTGADAAEVIVSFDIVIKNIAANSKKEFTENINIDKEILEKVFELSGNDALIAYCNKIKYEFGEIIPPSINDYKYNFNAA